MRFIITMATNPSIQCASDSPWHTRRLDDFRHEKATRVNKTLHKFSRSDTSRQIRLGFVALTDCAPLAMAQELGLFQKYGLRVVLEKELGWASIRDKIIYGELEAAHALAAMPLAATL